MSVNPELGEEWQTLVSLRGACGTRGLSGSRSRKWLNLHGWDRLPSSNQTGFSIASPMQIVWMNFTGRIHATLSRNSQCGQVIAVTMIDERSHGKISDEIGMASRRNPIPRDRIKSPIVGDHHHHHHHHHHSQDVARYDGQESHDCTNPGEQNLAGFQPNGHGTWSEDFPQHCVWRQNMQHRRCDSEGWHHQPHSF